MHNGEPKEKKSRNMGRKPITNSTKQIVQGDERKNSKDTKFRRSLSGCHNCPLQLELSEKPPTLSIYKMNIKSKKRRGPRKYCKFPSLFLSFQEVCKFLKFASSSPKA
jgi:hypothetical protein